MSTRAVIICAGEASRWQNHTGVPKHLALLNGERLIDRTTRLLYERGVTDIHVVTKEYNPLYDTLYGSQSVVTIDYDTNADADKFLSSKHLWNAEGRTLVVYGDVYFTEQAMDTIVGYKTQDWRLFCRPHGSTITGTKWGECFAQSFYPEQHQEHEQALHRIAQLYKDGHIKRCGGWEHYQEMCGVNKGFPRERMIVIDDLTDDVDYPEDYERLKHATSNQ